MATISYDRQSLMIGSRRIWLVSGSIHYARVPRESWRSRIRSAKQAGLNCIDTFVFWNFHESKPGEFDFEHDRDLRRFIEIIGEEGMYCILRPGPYIGADWDFGGLPPWLNEVEGVRYREANGPFKEATARYFGAVLEQVKDLQITSSTHQMKVKNGEDLVTVTGGPIVMMQIESRWTCDHPQQAVGYLVELRRYLREHGCDVPIIDCNHLWSRTEGVISTWSGTEHLPSDLRQLRVVQPEAPVILAECPPGHPKRWGRDDHPGDSASPESRPDRDSATPGSEEGYLLRLASVLAVGAQYNIAPFHGGTHFGFNGGRGCTSGFDFVATSYDHAAPLSEAGGHGRLYDLTKRISVFASQFDQLFAHLDAQDQQACLSVESDLPQGVRVLHQRGSYGEVVFAFKGAHDKTDRISIMLPNGLSLPVPLGDDRVAWFVIDANLGGVATLNYTNLRPWAFIGNRMLVLFGPGGADGLVCINESPFHVIVPTGGKALIEEHEDLTVVVLNHEQVDTAYLGPSCLVLGADGLDRNDRPIPMKGQSTTTIIHNHRKQKTIQAKPSKKAGNPKLTGWEQAGLDPYVDGTSPQYTPIEGPASLEKLGCGVGYGWYRLGFKTPVKGKALIPESGDRLHLFTNGERSGLIGCGPGAEDGPQPIHLEGSVVVLADNLGRFSDGWSLGERKGLYGDFYLVEPVKITGVKMTTEIAPDLFSIRGFYPYTRFETPSNAQTLIWKVKPTGKNPLIVEIDGLDERAILTVNAVPIGAYDPHLSGGRVRFVLKVQQALKTTLNEFRLTLLNHPESNDGTVKTTSKTRVLSHVKVYRATKNMTGKAAWGFAPWSVPNDEDFHTIEKESRPRPCWFRANFSGKNTRSPLWVEPIGMTKGQIYINGHNAGRYFVGSPTGDRVPTQQRYYLPAPWIHTDHPNQLMLFDEHGSLPGKCRLVTTEESLDG